MAIVLKNVSKKFHQQEVLSHINLELKEGKIYGFVGRNGSGKSVFFKLLCGFYQPTEGTILFDGKTLHELGDLPPDMRVLIEHPTFIGDLTGYENLCLLASIQKKIEEPVIKSYLEEFGLSSDQNKKYHKYSLGMKQKLGIIQVLMEDPNIMIFDEPFNGLEEETVELVRKILLEEKKKGKIILLASHIREDIELLCDEVYQVKEGTITPLKKETRIL